MDDRDGDEPRVALGAQIAGEVREHPVKQLVSVGRFGFGFVWGLSEAGARTVELVATSAVIQPVDPRAMRAFLRHVTQEAKDKGLSVEGEGWM